jgi:hypothetical protein
MKAAAMLMLAALLAAGCARPTADPFPSDIGAWVKTGATRSFDAAGLPQYIDGDAERFLRLGCEKAMTADYRHRDKAEAVADVFFMKNADAAKAVFDNEPASGSQSLPIGDAGRSNGQSVTFRSQRYFVRVVAYSPSAAVVELAKGIAARLR